MMNKCLRIVLLLAVVAFSTPRLNAGGGGFGGGPGGGFGGDFGGFGGGAGNFGGPDMGMGMDPAAMDAAFGGRFGSRGGMGGMGAMDGGGRGGMGGGGRSFGGMTMSLQQAIASPDDEWAVLQPKVQRVIEAQQQLPNSTSQFGGFGNGFGGGFGGRGNMNIGASAASPVAAALNELTVALQDTTQSEAVIKSKLDAYRSAVNNARAALKAAQEELRSLVTLRQEAILINLGYLD